MNRDDLLIALSESEHAQFGRVDFADQTEQRKVFSAVWALESEVSLGGFLQFFVNWDGDTAAFAPTALRAIGARACADLVERALRLASSSPLPPSQGAREEILESLPRRPSNSWKSSTICSSRTRTT